jgi:hypothetical protein
MTVAHKNDSLISLKHKVKVNDSKEVDRLVDRNEAFNLALLTDKR